MVAPQDDVVSLVRRAKVGNQEAFADLVLLYENELCGYLAALLRDRIDAQDCAQQTFFNAWRKLATLNDVTSFRPWLYTIARNVAWDYRRRRPKIVLQSWEGLEECCDNQTASKVEMHATQSELISLALAALPFNLRECLLLDVYGCSRSEIAQIRDIKVSSVATYLSMARKQFRQVYSRLEHES